MTNLRRAHWVEHLTSAVWGLLAKPDKYIEECSSASASCHFTLYEQRLRRHGRNQGSFCGPVLHVCLCRLLLVPTALCKWTRRCGGWKWALRGGGRSHMSKCRSRFLRGRKGMQRKRRRRNRRHGNLTGKTLCPWCCLLATSHMVIQGHRVTISIQHLGFKQTSGNDEKQLKFYLLIPFGSSAREINISATLHNTICTQKDNLKPLKTAQTEDRVICLFIFHY